MLVGFLKSAKDKKQGLNVAKFMTDEEQLQWEVLVKAMDSIDIMKIGVDLEKISKTYQLSRWQELSILAYVKILEMMIRRAKDAGALDMMNPPLPQKGEDPSDTPYTGSMFG